jgi:DNA-binding transcriptional LysR family regulator
MRKTIRGSQFAQLTAFAVVAEHSSFTKAAGQLGISTPSLSQTIRSLEEQFGVRLLNRTTRSVALTEAGAELLNHLNPVLEGVEKAVDAINAFRGKPAGTLRLTVHPVAAATIIAPLLARFSAEYPEIRLDFCVDDERKDIVSGRFDAGIHVADGIHQDMIAVPISEKVCVRTVASPDYLRCDAPLSGPADLREHNCIRHPLGANETSGSWKFRNADQQVEVGVEGSLTVNNLNLALRASLDGLGVVQLPESVVSPFVAEGRLIPVLTNWSPQWPDFVLFYSNHRHVPIKLRALIDFFSREAKHRSPAKDGKSLAHASVSRLPRLGAECAVPAPGHQNVDIDALLSV